MVSVTVIIRSGYYILKMIPLLVWTPLSLRLHLRRATATFESELIRNGLEPAVASEIANAFDKACKSAMEQATSIRSWN